MIQYIHLCFVYFICHFPSLMSWKIQNCLTSSIYCPSLWLVSSDSLVDSISLTEWRITFWYDVQQYWQYNLVAANEAFISIQCHLWYLTPELVVLALFDDIVSNDVKRMMAATLNQTVQPPIFDCGKKSTIIQSHICTPCITEATACEFHHQHFMAPLPICECWHKLLASHWAISVAN